MSWIDNLRRSHSIVETGEGPSCVVVVTGTQWDQRYWQHRLASTAEDVFRATRNVRIAAVSEGSRKGSFLGTINAWGLERESIEGLGLMPMVFGQGKRLSPFTQAMGSRKPALPTPMRGIRSARPLCTADLSNLYTNLWIAHLRASGFADGLVVKWGDEAIIPSARWAPDPSRFRDVDAVRFVWQTEPTETLAREKDWILIDRGSGLMRQELTRQPLESLRARLAGEDPQRFAFGVNLGSLAIRRPLLDALLEAFRDDLTDSAKWADWDPYAWIALCCASEAEWHEERRREQIAGRRGIEMLEARYPDFWRRIDRARAMAETKNGRPLRIGVLDFGEALWVDFGLHVTMRRMLESLTADDARGALSRALFGLPETLDARGNVVLRSRIASGADVRRSVIVDSVVASSSSILHNAVVAGTRAGTIHMPQGGTLLFSAARTIEVVGSGAIALRHVAPSIRLHEGARSSTLFLDGGPESIVSNESITDYDGSNYEQQILGNRVSFAEAGRFTSEIDGVELDARWQAAWERVEIE